MTTSDSRDIDHTKRIPPEILAEIFLFANVFVEAVLKPDNPPWLLGQICRRFRAVALSTPKLWCYLTPVLSRVGSSPISSILPLLSACFERSGQLPLTLTLDAEWPPALIASILSQSNRWGDASISNLEIKETRTAAQQSILTTLQSSDFTCLQTLHIHQRYGDFEGGPLSIVLPHLTFLTASSASILRYLSAPHLKTLSFVLLGFPTAQSSRGLQDFRSFLQKSSSSLTRLTLRAARVNNADLIDLLKVLHNLTELDIHHSTRPAVTDTFLLGIHSQKTVPCVVPRLRSLLLYGRIYWSDNVLLDMLESRCQQNVMACNPLLSVQLYPSLLNLFDAQVMKRLRALSVRGLDVSVFQKRDEGWVRFAEIDWGEEVGE